MESSTNACCCVSVRLADPRLSCTSETLRAPGFPVFPPPSLPRPEAPEAAPPTHRPQARAGSGRPPLGRRCGASRGPDRLDRLREPELGSSAPSGARAAGRGGASLGQGGASARAGGRGSPAPGAGHPEAHGPAALKPARPGAAGTPRGGGSTARAAAGCGHRWAAAESGAGVPETPVIAAVTPRIRDPGAASAPREKPTLLLSASASLAVAAPRLRSAGNFPPKVILRAGRRGFLGPPTFLRLTGAAEARPACCGEAGLDGDPERRPSSSPEPGRRPQRVDALFPPAALRVFPSAPRLRAGTARFSPARTRR